MHISPQRIVIATGGFDPCHQGHIAYLEAAKALGDHLVVGLNSDSWLLRKKDLIFMHWAERAAVLRAMRAVNEVIQFNDADGTAIDAIRQVRAQHPSSTIIFANGGDRTSKNVPEMRESNVEFAFGVGGDHKANSSSDILRRFERTLISKLSQDSNIFRSYT